MFSPRRSRIHGTGLYADRTISVGESLGFYTGRRFVEDALPPYRNGSPTYYWVLSNGRYIEGDSDLRFINHSCDPNVAAEEVTVRGIPQVEFKSIRRIPTGQEILLDYCLQAAPDDKEPYTCRCGSAKCRGTMLESSGKS